MNKFTWNNGCVDIEIETGNLSEEFVDNVNTAALLDRCFGKNDELIKKHQKESAQQRTVDALRKHEQNKGY